MAIEYKGKVYRNLQEQVLKNKDDIVELIDGVSDITGAVTNEIGEVVEQVSELNQEIAKALKLPMATPAATQLVGITPAKDQAMISLGEGLSLENNTLSVAGGGSVEKDKYIHFLKLSCYHEYYYNPGGYVLTALPLNTSEPFFGIESLGAAIVESFQTSVGFGFAFFDDSGRKCRFEVSDSGYVNWHNDADGETIDQYFISVEDLAVI